MSEESAAAGPVLTGVINQSALLLYLRFSRLNISLLFCTLLYCCVTGWILTLSVFSCALLYRLILASLWLICVLLVNSSIT